MLMPIRCFTCGAVVADKWEEYDKRVNKNNEDPGKVLDDLGVKRYCCRRMFLSNNDLLEEFMEASRK